MKKDLFIKALLDRLGWGYVLGGQGELYTPELAHKWAAQNYAGKSSAYFLNGCAHWFGFRVVDCSGLIIEAIRTGIKGYADQAADGLYANCKVKGGISSIPEKPGICVWRNGHIGVYLGGGMVIESGGYKVGVVKTQLRKPATGKAWTHWGELAAIDYTDEKPEAPNLEYIVTANKLAFRTGPSVFYGYVKGKKYLYKGEIVSLESYDTKKKPSYCRIKSGELIGYCLFKYLKKV